MNLLDLAAQVYYRCKVPLFEFKEERWVQKKFYGDPLFKALDQELLEGPNPYNQAAIFPYGETPLRALFTLANHLQLKPSDRLIDLGCGRGRAVFFLSQIFKCEAVGLDLTRSFIDRASRLARKHQQTRVSFVCQDFLTYDFRQATCVYLYGTTYLQEWIDQLEIQLKSLPSNSTIITVSAPLDTFQVSSFLDVQFAWGSGRLFFHRV